MTESPPWIRATGVLALSLSLLAPTRGRAQPADPKQISAAQSLYDQATAEMDVKSYASACPKLEEVQRLIPEGHGAKLTLAECYEGLGRLASAWSQYTLVENLARKAGKAEYTEQAAKKAAELRPRLASLTIEVTAEVIAIPGLEIKRDGVLLGEAQWGRPVPVDAGAHTIEATAPGKAVWQKTVEVEPKPGTVTLRVPVLASAPVPPRSTSTSPASTPKRVPVLASASVPSAHPSTGGAGLGPQRIAGFVTGGVGIAGIVVGSIFGAQAIAKKNASNADGHCDANNFCDMTGKALRREGLTAGNISTVGFIAGGALLAGGAILVLAAPARPVREATARVAIGLGSIEFEGTW